MGAKAERFEPIRREYDYGLVKGVPRKLGIRRRMVREALGGMRYRGGAKDQPARQAKTRNDETLHRSNPAGRRKARHESNPTHR
jgi:hypothetical protein